MRSEVLWTTIRNLNFKFNGILSSMVTHWKVLTVGMV